MLCLTFGKLTGTTILMNHQVHEFIKHRHAKHAIASCLTRGLDLYEGEDRVKRYSQAPALSLEECNLYGSRTPIQSCFLIYIL